MVADVTEIETTPKKPAEAKKLDRCLEILKEHLRALHKNWESADTGQINYFQAHLLHIEYSIAVHGIFTSRFIDSLAVLMKDENVKQHVSQHNGKKIINLGINEERIHMEKYLQFFADWNKEALELKCRKIKGWDKTFITKATYKNLRMIVCGFFLYAQIQLDHDDGPLFVPFSHANQSPVENIFSQVRSYSHDNAQGIPKALLAIKCKKNLDTSTLKCSRMYDAKLIESSKTVNDPSNIFECCMTI